MPRHHFYIWGVTNFRPRFPDSCLNQFLILVATFSRPRSGLRDVRWSNFLDANGDGGEAVVHISMGKSPLKLSPALGRGNVAVQRDCKREGFMQREGRNLLIARRFAVSVIDCAYKWQ